MSDGEKADELVITVTGYDAKKAMEFIAEQVSYRSREMIEATVNDAVSKAVAGVVPEVIEARIREEVERSIAEGWKPTNQWGEETGKRVTLKERINEVLTRKHSMGYGKGEKTFVEVVITDVIDTTLRKEFDNFYVEAKAFFKKALDEKFASTLNSALKHAFGER